MARMYPPYPVEQNRSDAERRVFGWIRDQISEDWSALHSLGLISHQRKPWAEIDFVLIGPSGVYCLEIKGGRVGRREGVWQFTDRHGTASIKTEGPFDQVAGAAAALRHHLVGKLPGVRNVVLGYGVVMPDITFEQTGPDILTEVLSDGRDLGRFREYVSRLSGHWRSRFPWATDVSNSLHQALVDELRGDFEFVPPLSHLVADIGSALVRLTSEQYKVLDLLAENPRVIVRGGAGTGKTLLAVESARRQSQAGKRVLLVCFNRNLAAHLRDVTQDSPSVCVWHFHGLMGNIISRAGDKARLPNELDVTDLMEVVYPSLCRDAILKLNEEEGYDALIVDEGQDLLMRGYVDVLDKLLKGGLLEGTWRVFLDQNQDIFAGSSAPAMDRLMAGHPTLAKLGVNCRNTAPIALATSLLSGITSEPTLVDAGPAVEYHWYSGKEEANRLVSECIDRLIAGGLGLEQIVVLSGHRIERSCVAEGLKSSKHKLEVWEGSDSRPATIRFSTVGAFKGLETDAVLLTDVAVLSSRESRMALYVGTSRARAILHVFLDKRCEGDYRQRAVEYGRRMATPLS